MMRRTNSVSFARKQVYLHSEQHNKLSMRYDTNEHKTFTTFIFFKYIKPSRNKSEDSEGEWNVGLTHYLLWHSEQLGQQSCKVYAPVALYPQGRSLVLTSVRNQGDPRAAVCGQKEQVTWKFPKTLQEIAPGTSHLMAQGLKQLHRSLHFFCY